MYIPEPKKNKDGTWSIQLRINKVSISVRADTAKECKRRAAIIKAEAQDAAKPIKKSELTLTQAIDAYIEKRERRSPATIRGYRVIQKHRFSEQMNRKIASFRPDEWGDILEAERKKVEYKTLQNAWGLVKAVLKENKIPVDEDISADSPKVKKDYVWLEPDEITKFVAAAKDDPLCVPMLLALMSMRISEIDMLRWENISPDAEFIHTSGARVLDENNRWIEKREQKNAASDRNVPLLIPELRAAIKRDWKPEGKLLAVSQATLRKAVTRVCAQAGVKRVTVHQLRHSFASLAAHLRIPMEIAMEIGGWANDKIMREIYTHIAQSDIERYKNDLWDFYNKRGVTANSPISLEYFIDFSRIEQLQNTTRSCSFSAIYSIIDFNLCY